VSYIEYFFVRIAKFIRATGAGKVLNPKGIIDDDPLGAAEAAMAEAAVSYFKWKEINPSATKLHITPPIPMV
jgi:hypothetical protein